MSKMQFFSIILYVKRVLEELSRSGCGLVALSGGEPFLSEDLGDIVCYARGENGISGIQIVSNGTRVTEEELEKVKPYVSGVPLPLMAASE